MKRTYWSLQGPSVSLTALTSKTVEGTSLPLESVDHVHGSDSLPLGVLGVGDGVPDDVLEEHLEDSTGLLIDESGDTLDSSTAGQPPDGGLGDTLDVVTENLPVTLGPSLSKSLSSFTTSGHIELLSLSDAVSAVTLVFIEAGSKSEQIGAPIGPGSA